jgi:hypothetical protein
MTRHAEPERELIRRWVPFAPPAFLLALLLGAAVDGWHTGWSAAIGVTLVVANSAAAGLAQAWAAGVSLMVLAAVTMAGFAVRLGVIVGVMALLANLSWFSGWAFALAVVPATILLLGFEMRLLARGVGRELILPATDGKEVA